MNLQGIIEDINSIDSAKEKINLDQKNSINEIAIIENYLKSLDKQNMVLTERRKALLKQLSKYATFNADIIGDVIAKLLTVVYNDVFVYHTPLFSFYDSNKRKNIPFRTITKASDYKTIYQKGVGDGDVILDKNESASIHLSDDICLYNWDLDLNINIPFRNTLKANYFKVPSLDNDYHDTIKGFIDYLVDYRMQNKMEEITEEDINNLLDNYLKSIRHNLTLQK